MEVRSDGLQQVRYETIPVTTVIERTRLKVWFIRVCSTFVVWTCLVQLVAIEELWRPSFLANFSYTLSHISTVPSIISPPPPPVVLLPPIARFLNLTLVVPELDKTSFWADTSNFEDIFDVNHFIDSLRDEVQIIRRLPKRYNRKYGFQPLVM